MLRASDLDWTVVLPVTLVDGRASGTIRAVDLADDRAGVTLRSRMSRADVAAFLVEQIDQDAWLR